MEYSDLLKEIVNTATTLTDRWGGDVRIGRFMLQVRKSWDVTNWVHLQTDFLNSTVIKLGDNGYFSESGAIGINDALDTAHNLEQMALLLASDDFVKKIEGSIRRLKGVQKSLTA